MPIAIVAHERRAAALAVVHAGWRGLAAGVVEAAVAALGGGADGRDVGPAIGPCCYEVGPEVSDAVRPRPDPRRHPRPLDAPPSGRSAAAGVERVERLDLCTRCNPDRFFSHRRSGARHGAQGVIGARRRLRSASGYERVRGRGRPGVTVVAATKYVALADMAVLVEAGIEVVGENRAQDLEAKHADYGDAFRWHFIGRLQSNKVKVVNRICELVALARLARRRRRGSRSPRSCR